MPHNSTEDWEELGFSSEVAFRIFKREYGDLIVFKTHSQGSSAGLDTTVDEDGNPLYLCGNEFPERPIIVKNVPSSGSFQRGLG